MPAFPVGFCSHLFVGRDLMIVAPQHRGYPPALTGGPKKGIICWMVINSNWPGHPSAILLVGCSTGIDDPGSYPRCVRCAVSRERVTLTFCCRCRRCCCCSCVAAAAANAISCPRGKGTRHKGKPSTNTALVTQGDKKSGRADVTRIRAGNPLGCP